MTQCPLFGRALSLVDERWTVGVLKGACLVGHAPIWDTFEGERGRGVWW
jgi:hypothetical protein